MVVKNFLHTQYIDYLLHRIGLAFVITVPCPRVRLIPEDPSRIRREPLLRGTVPDLEVLAGFNQDHELARVGLICNLHDVLLPDLAAVELWVS